MRVTTYGLCALRSSDSPAVRGASCPARRGSGNVDAQGGTKSVMSNAPRPMVIHRQPGGAALVLAHPVLWIGPHPVVLGTDDRATDCLVVQRLCQRMSLHESKVGRSCRVAQRPRSRMLGFGARVTRMVRVRAAGGLSGVAAGAGQSTRTSRVSVIGDRGGHQIRGAPPSQPSAKTTAPTCGGSNPMGRGQGFAEAMTPSARVLLRAVPMPPRSDSAPLPSLGGTPVRFVRHLSHLRDYDSALSEVLG